MEQLSVMGNKVLEFLKDDSKEIFRVLEGENQKGTTKFYITVAKVKVGNFIRVYVGNESEFGMKDLEFSGLMNLDTEKFYDVRYNLRRMGFGCLEERNLWEMKKELTDKVNARLKEIALATGLKNIDEFKPKEEEMENKFFFDRRLEDLEYDTKMRAKDAYLEGKAMDDIQLNFAYDKADRDLGNDEILLKYINGEESLVEDIVNKILTKDKENIYVAFMFYLHTRKQLKDFILGTAKETEMLDTIKRMVKACEGKKTVTITYEKEGKIWEGKVEVGGCGGIAHIGKGCLQDSLEQYKVFGYNIISKAEREHFYEMFGRWADLDLAHITGIKYKGKECL